MDTIGAILLVILGLYVIVKRGFSESQQITDKAPPAPPTTDAYDEGLL